MLPLSPFAVGSDTIERQLGQSDFVFLLGAAGASLPFDRQMIARYEQTRSWCHARMVHCADLETLGVSVGVFERPDLARLRGDAAIGLTETLARSSSASDLAARPPEAPFFATPPRLLLSADVEFAVRLEPAFTPVTFAARGLPDGVVLDPRSGILRGQVHRPGTYTARLTVANSAGTTSGDLVLTVAKDRFLVAVASPPAAAIRQPIDLTYQAFDAASRLDFIDITDLSTGQALERLPADEDQHQAWQGLYRITFAQAGVRNLSFRFVRFDPKAKDPTRLSTSCARLSSHLALAPADLGPGRHRPPVQTPPLLRRSGAALVPNRPTVRYRFV